MPKVVRKHYPYLRNMAQSFSEYVKRDLAYSADWLQNQAQQSLHYSQLPPPPTIFGNELNWLNDRLNDSETIKRRAAQALLAGPFAPLLDQWGRGERDKALMQRIMYDKGYSNIPIPEDYYFTLNPLNRWR